jgi:Zn-dependent peptidase ImmA (M78 family)
VEGKTNRSLDPAIEWAQKKYLSKDLFWGSPDLALREVRNAILLIVSDLIKHTNQEIPVDLKPIAPLRKIRNIMETEISVDGILIPENGGFTIKVRENIHPFKKRFAIAHEMGHTFFFNIEVDPPRREFAFQDSNYWVQEEFACRIAREILVPSFSVCSLIASEKLLPSISGLRYLSALYQVSYDVLRFRLVNDLPLWDCVIFESAFSEGRFLTKGCNISKGKSHKEFIMPKIISRDDVFQELYCILLASLKQNKINDTVQIQNRKYHVETLLLDRTRQSVLTILS